MKLAKLFSIFILGLMVSCEMKPATPLIKPTAFDSKAYVDSLKYERSRSTFKSTPKKTQTQTDPLDSASQKSPVKVTTDTIQVKIQNGKAKIDTAKVPGQRLVFVLDTDTANKLSLKLESPDSLANLRIAQILDSKGNSDGPFGRNYVYPIQEKGQHQIIVSESQMQGEPWGGKFSIEIKLGW